ncbi:MAG: Mur ligase domain-containing protein [Patescibacteria group bacterium]
MNKHPKNQYPPTKEPFSFQPRAGQPWADIEPKSVHFAGILGIGVSSLAQWFLAQKWAVSGSDIALNPIYQELKKVGIKAKIGHKKANIPASCGLFINSQAIRPDNPEFKEAGRRKIPILSYPEALGEMTKFYKTICVSGMHGKSTTTAMAGLMLVKAGLDPTIIIGTRLKELGNKNFRAGLALPAPSRIEGNNAEGKTPYLVLEADEYKDAFLNYSPAFAIATNLDREHLDYFKSTEKIKKSFLEFFSRTRGGALILNRDNEMLHSLSQKIDKIRKSNNLRVEWYSLRNKEVDKIKKHIKLPGKHNISNALSIFCLSKFLGISEKVFLSSISKYNGSWRRMEYRGKFWVSGVGCRVYDDYAHHPTEIKATLAAFREKFPNYELICVFQPHQAERLKLLFKEFKTAFNEADKTVILPIYKVAGREPARAWPRRRAGGSSSGSKYDSEALVKSMQKMVRQAHHKSEPLRLVFYVKELKNLKNALEILLSNRSFPCPTVRQSSLRVDKNAGHTPPKKQKPAVIIMMGAGNIVNYTDSLVK